MDKKETKEPKEKKVVEPKYTLEQLRQSKQFAKDKYVLEAVLQQGEYTVTEAKQAIKKYLERGVK